MTRIPQLERALYRAAVRETRRRRRRLWKPGVLAAVATIALAGGAVAAVNLMRAGEPVPNTPAAHAVPLLGMHPGAEQLLALRAPDPAGGLPWGVAVIRQADGRMFCAMVGRVQGNAIGVVGRDAAFHDDGRFHALPADADQGQVCGGVARGGQLYVSSSGPPIPASGYTGSFAGQVGGCRENVPASSMSAHTRRALRGVPVCPTQDLRVVKFGFAGRHATRVEYGNRRVHLVQRPARGSSGAYLFVLRPQPAASGPLVLSVTYADGTVCRDDQIAASRECLLPPGA